MPKPPTKSQLANLKLGPKSKIARVSKSVTFDLHPDRIDGIDAIAKSKGISRGAEIRSQLEAARSIEPLKHSVIPRGLLDDDEPDGYMQSDKDFVLNNIDVCVEFLEILEN